MEPEKETPWLVSSVGLWCIMHYFLEDSFRVAITFKRQEYIFDIDPKISLDMY